MMRDEDNRLITRVCGDAPMGGLMRENFWIPVGLSSMLVADGQPIRVKLLGDSFVAWRSTDGRAAMFDEGCPHRGVSLTIARNEDNALRCLFHGWKFSVSGRVLEVPTEPNNEAEFCKSVPLKHYPVREAGGIFWVWLGKADPPALPELEFLDIPDDQVYPVRQIVPCNWVQGVEGGMDAAHVGILHSGWLATISKNSTMTAAGVNTAPVYEFEERPGGFRYAALRRLADGTQYIRLNEFLAPWYCFIAAETGAKGDRTVLMSIPVDDETMMNWSVRYNPFGPLGPSSFNPVADQANWPPLPNGSADNYWGQDRAAMKRHSFSGFNHPTTEDFVVWAAQGRIADRSRDFLNSGDRAVVRVRNILVDAVKQYQAGATPSIALHDSIPFNAIRPMADTVSQTFDWRKLAV